MLLLVLGWVMWAGFVWLLVWGIRKGENGPQIAGWIGGIILGLTMAISTICVPLSNQGKLQELSAFYNANAHNYEVAASKTCLILSETEFIMALIPVEGSIEKLGVGEAVAARVYEWRDKVTKYNVELARFQYFHNHPVVGYYYPEPVGLKLITIE